MANNNYDRMLLGEKQQPTSIENKAKQKRKAQQNKTANALKIVVLVLSVVGGLMTLGAMGGLVQSFWLGVFGWLGVGYALAIILYCALSLAGMGKGRKLTKSKKWLIAGGAVMVFIVLLFAHLWSSYAAYDAVMEAKDAASYGDYLGEVYRHGASTAGGAALSLVAYPFLNAVGLRLSGIILAVLFFAVLFSMIYPFWLTTKEQRVIGDVAVAENGGADEPKLFVETVDGSARANKARGKKRRENFDFSYPNGNEEEEKNTPDELDLVDENDTFAPPVDSVEARRQNAFDLLVGMKNETTQVQDKERGYDPAKDGDHPLQFGERENTHADWARPADSVPREQLPEKERKQQSYDILFGDKPAPKTFAAYTPKQAQPRPKPQGLAAGDTIETVVSSPRDRNDLNPSHEVVQQPSNAVDDVVDKTVYKIPDNGAYVNRANPVQPAQAPKAPAYGEQREERPAYGQETWQAPRTNPQPQWTQERPVENPQREWGERQTDTYGNQTNLYYNAEPKEDRMPERTIAPQRQAEQPVVPQEYTPKYNEPAERADAQTNMFFGAPERTYQDKPLAPEDANLVKPREYPTYEEESDLDSALHHVQDDYVEPEEAAPVDPIGYVERDEQDAPQSAFGGFVERQIKEEPKEEEPEVDPPVQPEEHEVKPRYLAVPDEKTKREARAFQPDPKEVKKVRPYTAPPLYLLKDYPPPEDTEDYEGTSKNLEEAFASYGVEVHVIGYTRGPTYTQFAVRLGEGIQFKRVSGLGQDIVRKMCLSEEINIVPKVPNMDAIGVEIINKTRSRVGLKPLLTNSKFRQDRKLYFVLGVDVMGRPYYCDILSGPHMLIAGSSGSGKSVCLNTLICSLLYNYKPDYVKFILIDPKGGVEMGVYNDLPHNLLGKAAVTPANAIKAMDWAIEEMERRYGLMRDLNVRSWGDYNDKLIAGNLPRQPYILLIIDELADLMASSKKNAADLEVRIARLTAKARAAGIHVIVATQRPSVDVITGTIKNNIPTRVAFKTASQIDSKTILEKGCAEKLYGKGDMYFMSSEFNELKRLQGPFLTDDEVNIICENIRANNDCLVDEVAANSIFKEEEPAQEEKSEGGSGYDSQPEDGDEMSEEVLFEKAVRYAADQGFVSISRLQRMFRLGFNRAALLMDEMEARGFVDKQQMGSSKPRRVLLTPNECDDIFGARDDDDD